MVEAKAIAMGNIDVDGEEEPYCLVLQFSGPEDLTAALRDQTVSFEFMGENNGGE